MYQITIKHVLPTRLLLPYTSMRVQEYVYLYVKNIFSTAVILSFWAMINVWINNMVLVCEKGKPLTFVYAANNISITFTYTKQNVWCMLHVQFKDFRNGSVAGKEKCFHMLIFQMDYIVQRSQDWCQVAPKSTGLYIQFSLGRTWF